MSARGASNGVAFSEADRAFMRRALFTAERGRGRTSPNPIVGAVVVSPDGIVLGQGAHLEAGGPHAEVHALAEAGDRARGATLYCTLEPCAHVGRTPPCAPRVAEAGASRAVVAMTDPNPRVAGEGIALLRARGVRVDVGLCGDEAARANAAFLTWMTKRRPHVTLKIARSHDGFVGRPDMSVKLTGAAMDRLMHRQRAEVDAIAIGAGTLLADDPVLTPRGAFRARPLTRVVFDWRLRGGGDRRLYRTLDAGPVLIVTTEAAAAANAQTARDLQDRGVELFALPQRDLARAMTALGDLSITSLLVEGGPGLQDAFAAAHLVDRVQTIVVPRTLGAGVAAPRLLELEGKLAPPREEHAGGDTLLEADVHGLD
ncbi:MAG TPA: bifunctional diaminohydroxyphosphoribosylaminopyrimidine deaminase/5-amino-6-(5-phosphoribosylamino)uracil reductase RibD [Vicinamibacterales bacterium]|nr:bifunctional diaminohydroxyphosphoribosylaminopyrimidine deaminase/5-amino-6-(5-phosphoribosylamino)uracil reductase RibD [Vicinamibacterales bacterium]